MVVAGLFRKWGLVTSPIQFCFTGPSDPVPSDMLVWGTCLLGRVHVWRSFDIDLTVQAVQLIPIKWGQEYYFLFSVKEQEAKSRVWISEKVKAVSWLPLFWWDSLGVCTYLWGLYVVDWGPTHSCSFFMLLKGWGFADAELIFYGFPWMDGELQSVNLADAQ